MKKLHLLCLGILCAYAPMFGQTNTARVLSTEGMKTSPAEVAKLVALEEKEATYNNYMETVNKTVRRLAPYFDLKGTYGTEALTIIRQNPFFEDLLPEPEIDEDEIQIAASISVEMRGPAIKSRPPSPYSTVSSTSPTTAIINGAAKFLIDRTNQEIQMAIFDRMVRQMDQYEELPVLLPATRDMLSHVQADHFPVALNALKTNFTDDIEHLLFQLPELSVLPTYQAYIAEEPNWIKAFSAIDFVVAVKEEQTAAQALTRLATRPYSVGQKDNYAMAIQSAQLFSYCLLKANGKEGAPSRWMSYSDFTEVQKDERLSTFVQFFFGIMYQLNPDIQFFDDQGAVIFDLKESLSNQAGNVYTLTELFNNLLDATSEAEISQQKTVTYGFTRTGNIDQAAKRSYTQSMEKTLQLATSSLAILNRLDYRPTPIQGLNGQIQQTLLVADHAVQGLKQMEEGELNAAVYELLGIFIDVVKTQQESRQLELMELTAEGETTNFRRTRRDYEVKALQDQINHWYRVLDYTNLIATLSIAENSDQVRMALHATALPTGSSRAKKYAHTNIALNAYVGYYLSDPSIEPNALSGFTNTHGLTAPIGLTVSRGFRKAGSLSLYAAPIDIGRILSYQIDNNGQPDPTVNWNQVFSPTVSVAYGFPYYLPFSIGIGSQWQPTTVAGGNSIELTPRWYAFIGVDIPLFNLLNRE